MAQYGIQPNGKIGLDDGTMWDPNDPLPPEAVSAFNSTPMGNPLLPSTLPRAQMPSAPSPTPPAFTPPMPNMAPVPQGTPVSIMSGYTSPTFASNLLHGMGQPSPTMPRGMFAAQPTPLAKPSFFGEGGTGRNIAGIIGDALLAANNRPMIFNEARQQAMKDARSGQQQMAELARQVALEQWKTQHPEDTEPVRNAKALGLIPGTEPFNDYVYNSTMAPVITTVNGNPMAFSRAQVNDGIAGSSGAAAPSFPRVSDAASYNALKSGDHFLDPEGNVRVKP